MDISGIWETELADINELHNDFNIPEFNAQFYINNQLIEASDSRYKNNNGLREHYYLSEYRNKNYCIYLSVPKSNELTPELLHTQKSITDLFQYNHIFEGAPEKKDPANAINEDDGSEKNFVPAIYNIPSISTVKQAIESICEDIVYCF